MIAKKFHIKLTLGLVILLASFSLSAQMHHEHLHQMSPKDCSEMMIWDYQTANCQPLAMAGMPIKMWMIHGNAFFVQNFTEGPRGRNKFSIPNMIMGDVGSSLGERHYVNLDLMLTFEKWTFPKKGYPELFQIGEKDKSDQPYVDAQHPHSSPIMGITLSDTYRFGETKDHLKLFFSPRGQATEGPIAFMHRSTGMINPDAPLGHHIGQDVSHISSTVLGASLGIGEARFEASVFNGTEPEPTKVDLPVSKINSYAGRFIYEFTSNLYAMLSVASIKDPEPHDPDLEKIYRYSSSIYYNKKFNSEWMYHNTLIFGLVNYYDHFSKLRSFDEEFLFHSIDLPHNIWGRVEFVERGPSELQITSISNDPLWVKAFTLGYTNDILKFESNKLGLGFSVTKNIIPNDFQTSYGKSPVSVKIFLQLTGMKMGDL